MQIKVRELIYRISRTDWIDEVETRLDGKQRVLKREGQTKSFSFKLRSQAGGDANNEMTPK